MAGELISTAVALAAMWWLGYGMGRETERSRAFVQYVAARRREIGDDDA